MKEREYLIKLFDIYGPLLTKRQQEYFKDYYYEDLSLSEIAENYNVSKTVIGKTINNCENKLKNYENIIRALDMKERLEK